MGDERLEKFREEVETYCRKPNVRTTEKLIAQRILLVLVKNWDRNWMKDDTQGFLLNLYRTFPRNNKSKIYKIIKDACEVFSQHFYGEAFNPNDPFGA